MNIQLGKVAVKRIPLENDSEILELAEKLCISLDSESVRNMIDLETKSLHSETQLKQTVKELEEKKEKLESDFQEIAFQSIKLEAKYVGVRNQISRIYRENRVLTLHLCARAPRNEHERHLRDKLIQKYLIDSKLM